MRTQRVFRQDQFGTLSASPISTTNARRPQCVRHRKRPTGNLLPSPPPLRQRRRGLGGGPSGREGLDADVLVELGPVNPLAVADDLVVFSFRRGSVEQSRVPHQGSDIARRRQAGRSASPRRRARTRRRRRVRLPECPLTTSRIALQSAGPRVATTPQGLEQGAFSSGKGPLSDQAGQNPAHTLPAPRQNPTPILPYWPVLGPVSLWPTGRRFSRLCGGRRRK